MRAWDLTQQQFRLLEHIFKQIRTKSKPPTVREICSYFGFASPRSASDHLKALERKGYLRRTGSSRGIELSWHKVWQLFGIPIVGTVPAGKPRLAYAETLGNLTPEDFYPAGEGFFAMQVQGDSMVGVGIMPGDYVVVREQLTAEPGEIVVAVVDEEEITVKRLMKRGNKLYLEAANPRYPAIALNGGRIWGRVIKVHRDL